MSAFGHKNIWLKLAGGALLVGVVAPATVGFASETPLAYVFESDPVPAILSGAPPAVAVEAPAAAIPAEAPPFQASTVQTGTAFDPNAPLDAELECMAKVVHHEAANQSRRGQLAVAQLIMNRIESGKFPKTICGVAHQRGQFFNTTAYNPKRTTDQWRSAVDVSREALAGKTEDVVPGAIFYHAAYAAPNRWFRTRQKITTLGDHIFYR